MLWHTSARTHFLMFTLLCSPMAFCDDASSAQPEPTAVISTPTPSPTPVPTAASPVEKTSAKPSAPEVHVIAAEKPALILKAYEGNEEHKKICEQFYRGKIQTGVRRACQLGGQYLELYGKTNPFVAETACRLQYGEEPSETFACMIGSHIAGESKNKTKEFQTAFQLCSEVYPVRTELDGYLLESCLIGVYAPVLTFKPANFNLCANITHERSFWGPCTVGVSLAKDTGLFIKKPEGDSKPTSKVIAIDHRIFCEKYFDHLKFHLGYRSCLNAKATHSSLLPQPTSFDEVKFRCEQVVSDPGNDHERGACLVGTALLESVLNQNKNDIFHGCGQNQVRFEDRDYLGCLTAASIIYLKSQKFVTSQSEEKLCREYFRDKKGQALSGCISSISTLAKEKL